MSTLRRASTYLGLGQSDMCRGGLLLRRIPLVLHISTQHESPREGYNSQWHEPRRRVSNDYQRVGLL